MLISFNINQETINEQTIWRRDWRKYSKETLLSKLGLLNWSFELDSVQDYWNELENQLIGVVDSVEPLTKSRNNTVVESIPSHIKQKSIK